MPDRSLLRWRGYWVPKRGHSAEEYEDAFAAAPEIGRFAIADGASESSFASLWARLLVEGFVHPTREAVANGDWRCPLRERWAAEVDGKELAWYADDKRQLGAFATFLGLKVRQGKEGAGGRWQAIAVGDSCLFQIRKDHLLIAYPLNRSQDFGTRPDLLGSRGNAGNPAAASEKTEWGRWQPGDRFFLMTDALAQWFLLRCEAKQKPWQSLLRRLAEAKPEAALAAYVEKLRDQGELKNDDVTVVVIDLLSPRPIVEEPRPSEQT